MSIDNKVNDIIDTHIRCVDDLNIEHLAYCLDIKVGFNSSVNCYMRMHEEHIILLRSDDPFNQWLNFCHELGHLILHSSKQHTMHPLFNDMQESQANRFALLLIMPGKLISENKLYNAKSVSQYFNVPFEYALKRLELYANNLKANWG